MPIDAVLHGYTTLNIWVNEYEQTCMNSENDGKMFSLKVLPTWAELLYVVKSGLAQQCFKRLPIYERGYLFLSIWTRTVVTLSLHLFSNNLCRK